MTFTGSDLVALSGAVVGTVALLRARRAAKVALGARATARSLTQIICAAPIDLDHPGIFCLRITGHVGEHAYTLRAIEAAGYQRPPF